MANWLRRDPYWYKKRVQQLMTQLTDGRFSIFEKHRHGISDVADIARICRNPRVIFDVGANIGQSAIRFRAAFPRARILCFEPIAQTFAELCRRVDGLDVECFSMALGDRPGRTAMYLTGDSLTSSIMRPIHEDPKGEEVVEVSTIDEFVASHSIDHIDFLKIDAEGFDLQVLEGGEGVLSDGRVQFILVEVGFTPDDARHPLFENVRDLLMRRGYRVHGFYDQTLEWTGEPCLRFANVLFCRQATAKASRAEVRTSEHQG